MNDQGYVYILINASMDGLIKVGKTTRSPKDRADELSKATGVPTPFIVAYEAVVNNCSKAESFVHTWLETKGYRVSDNREFFNAPMTEAVNAIVEYKNNHDDELIVDTQIDDVKANCEVWDCVEKMAYDLWTGHGDTLKDTKEALKLYKQAYKLGSITACQQVGWMYKVGVGCERDDETALKYFKECVQKGFFDAYGDMMEIYFRINSIDNALKCWEFYVEQCQDNMDGYTCVQYMVNMYMLNLPITHIKELRNYKDAIIQEHSKFAASCGESTEYNNVLRYMKYVLFTDSSDVELKGKEYIIQTNQKAAEEVKRKSERIFNVVIVLSIIVGVIITLIFSPKSFFLTIIFLIVFSLLAFYAIVTILNIFPFGLK